MELEYIDLQFYSDKSADLQLKAIFIATLETHKDSHIFSSESKRDKMFQSLCLFRGNKKQVFL